MTALIPTKIICMEEFYKLNKDSWYMIDNKGKKIPNRPWQEFWCSLHKRTHKDIKL